MKWKRRSDAEVRFRPSKHSTTCTHICAHDASDWSKTYLRVQSAVQRLISLNFRQTIWFSRIWRVYTPANTFRLRNWLVSFETGAASFSINVFRSHHQHLAFSISFHLPRRPHIFLHTPRDLRSFQSFRMQNDYSSDASCTCINILSFRLVSGLLWRRRDVRLIAPRDPRLAWRPTLYVNVRDVRVWVYAKYPFLGLLLQND